MDNNSTSPTLAFQPNVNLMKVFSSKLMMVNDIPDAENGMIFIKAGADGPPIHSHDEQEEYFNVISGQLQVYDVDKWITLNEGDEHFTPKNVAHSYRSRYSQDCIFAYRLTPKRNFSDMMQTFERLIDEGKLKSTSDIRSLLYLSLVFKKYRSELTSINPPQFVMNTLSSLAGMLGFKL